MRRTVERRQALVPPSYLSYFWHPYVHVPLPWNSNVLMATASCDDTEPATSPTDRSTLPLVDSFVGNVNNQVVSPVDYDGPPVRGHLVFNACFESGKYTIEQY